MIERVVYHGASDQLVVRLATGTIVQALFVRDGSPEKWTQGTAVQVHLPADALRVLPPSPAASSAQASAAAEEPASSPDSIAPSM